LELDFDRKLVNGSVTYTMRSLVDSLEKIFLDARYLIIHDVKFQNGDHLDFWFYEPNPNIGPFVNIGIWRRVQKGEVFNITIDYETTNETLSLNWLEPSQTAGKDYPYVYTH
jgi:leukotriene-A4 hydrolase